MSAYDYKERTKFGRWCDSKGIKQSELPVHRNTASRLFNDEDYEPYESTIVVVISFLRNRGYDVRISDFW
ncbi:hypothetical protein PCURB6_28280 [Paenibacillus curdlanolyticus]|nr:hypothetical protein PCURB6_28280 [Paenibacillus curdlanolyticus]